MPAAKGSARTPLGPKETELIPTSEKVVAIEAVQVSRENEDFENDSNVATIQVQKETGAEEASAENVNVPGDTTVTNNAVIEEITDEICNDAEYLETSEKPTVVIVHALAAFENSRINNECQIQGYELN